MSSGAHVLIRVLAILLTWAIVTMPRSASAETADPEVRAGALATFVLNTGDVCEADLDVVGCAAMSAYGAGELVLQVQLSPPLSIGPYFMLGFELDQSRTQAGDGIERDSHAGYFASAGVDLRGHPWGPRAFWLGTRAGWIGVRDIQRPFDDLDSAKNTTSQQSAASVGVGLGYDLVSPESVGAQFSLHADYAFFSGSYLPRDRETSYNPGVWVHAGVGVLADL